MFSSKNKKNNVYPSKPQFYYIKLGFKGVKIIYCRHVFMMISLEGEPIALKMESISLSDIKLFDNDYCYRIIAYNKVCRQD